MTISVYKLFYLLTLNLCVNLPSKTNNHLRLHTKQTEFLRKINNFKEFFSVEVI